VEVKLHPFGTSSLNGRDGQVHAEAVLSEGRQPQHQLDRRGGWSTGVLNRKTLVGNRTPAVQFVFGHGSFRVTHGPI